MSDKLIYLVEDDHLKELLSLGFGDSLKIDVIETHSEFLARFEDLAARRPVCILLDVMLPWSATEISAADVSFNPDSFMTAGVECYRKIRADKRTAHVPVLLYSVWDRKDVVGIPLDADYLRKDAPDRRIIMWVNDAVAKARES
jgi:CheY-like chemotaxis protein